jgi:4'-phosphopantetheinyl transferase
MIGERQIHVWIARADVDAATIRSLSHVLDDEERGRAARFHFDADRRRSIVGRAALRILLGRYLGRNASDLRFAAGAHGKPRLCDAALEFNVSHSGDFAAIALAADTPVGIDVECEKRMSDLEAIASRYFAPAEAEAVLKAQGAQAVALFFSTWTAKESVIKAAGAGLSLELGAFRVTPGSDRFMPVENGGADVHLDGWYVRALPSPAHGYHAALAARGGGWTTIIDTFES